jgi:glycosyltransferase involved in cell wall biosynthesis
LSTADAQRYAATEAALWPYLRGCLCPSATTARALTAAGITPDRIAIVPPGTHKPAAIETRISGKGIELLTVATITPRKGHLLLVEALAGLHDLDWRLTCIGSLERDPDTAAALMHAIARYRLEDRIHLAGERPPECLTDAYRAADVFVLPSFHEGYGMAYAEALAHGLPVIATTAGAVPDTVPATAGLFVPPGDVRALRDALRKLLLDARLRTRLAAGAAQAATSLPDWPASARLWWNAVRRLAA